MLQYYYFLFAPFCLYNLKKTMALIFVYFCRFCLLINASRYLLLFQMLQLLYLLLFYKKNLKKTMAGRAKTPTVLASSLSSSLTMGMPATSASSSMFSSSCSTLEHCLQSLSESSHRESKIEELLKDILKYTSLSTVLKAEEAKYGCGAAKVLARLLAAQ